MIENLSAPGELAQWSEGCVEALQNGDFTRIRVRNHRRLILAEYGADDILIDLSEKGPGRVYLHIESTSKEVLRWFKSCVTEAMLSVRPNVNPNAGQAQSSRAQHTPQSNANAAASHSGQSAFDQAYRKAQAARRQASQEEQMAQTPGPDATRIAPDTYREEPFDPDATRIAKSPFERARDRQLSMEDAAQAQDDIPPTDDTAFDTSYDDDAVYDGGAYDDYDDGYADTEGYDDGYADDYGEEPTAEIDPVDYGDEAPEGDTQYLEYPEDALYKTGDVYAPEDYDDAPYDDGYADGAVYDGEDGTYEDDYADGAYDDYGGDGYADAEGYDDSYADDDEALEPAAPQTFKEKWEALTEKTWFLLLMLAVFPPLGLYLIWHYRRWTGGKRVLATAIGLLYFLFVWLGFLGVNTGINRDTFTSLRSRTSQSTGSNVQNTPDTSSDSTDTSNSTDSTTTDSTANSADSTSGSNTVLEQAVSQFNNWVSNLVP